MLPAIGRDGEVGDAITDLIGVASAWPSPDGSSPCFAGRNPCVFRAGRLKAARGGQGAGTVERHLREGNDDGAMLGGVRGIAIAIALGSLATARGDDDRRALSLAWDREILTIRGAHLPGGAVEILYIEAYCRPGSTKREWKQTVIPHKTERIEASLRRQSDHVCDPGWRMA